MKFNLFSNPSHTGIDIQSDALRLVRLKKTRRGFQLLQAALEPLPADMFADGRIKRWDTLQTLLSHLADALNLRGEHAVLCLPMQVVRMQRLTLPVGLSDEDIEAEISLHMQQEMPGLNEQLCIDFTLFPAADNGYDEAVFAAVRENYLSSYVECARAAGFKVKIVDVVSYAVRRALPVEMLSPQSQHEAEALLQIKNNQTELFVFNHQEFIFHQHWNTASVADCLLQLKESLQVFAAAYREYQLKRLFICGEMSYAEALRNEAADMFATKIILPTITARLLTALNANEEWLIKQPAEFMAALGAAMREVPPW